MYEGSLYLDDTPRLEDKILVAPSAFDIGVSSIPHSMCLMYFSR
jgi:hypothetical protein